MKELRQISVVGLGLLGGSVCLSIQRRFPTIKVVGYTHRPVTRRKARKLAVAAEIADEIKPSVSGADLVILASPIYTFEEIFSDIAEALPKGCIVSDVGSVKALPHRWAGRILPKTVRYVGSHPIAGSEHRGVEFARDDLFEKAPCILTATKTTNQQALRTLKKFWSTIGCSVKVMTPAKHDIIFANVSHLPHAAAAALINSNTDSALKFAGRGFIDTSRIASGPANIWADVMLANADNITKAIDRMTGELAKLEKAIKNNNRRQIEAFLKKASSKRSSLIRNKMKRKELML
ncbi:MAG: prephenate dehydrogenase/arogenate dehydrogenase family protein [Sedimentisphaerales bacterium]|nr:prephenate dehydrogenase/arogenate dehydrogenase family protein [Sedimentisphaerales bacterium]